MLSLVDREKILLSPLHIKLGMMKQFVNALETVHASSTYARNFPHCHMLKSEKEYSMDHRFVS
jgi:hypothetical protein